MKRCKIYKSFLALLIIIIFCFENYAAIVSDNDGSAFVTKSEFESLKKDFAGQINNYNDSIDAKIDGAIAAYLAGINMQKAQSLDTVLKNWNEVTMRNYEYPNEYEVPGAMISLSYYGSGHNTSWNRYPSAYGLALVGKSLSNKAKMKSVILIEGNETDYNDLSKNKFYWNGLITDYEEKIAMSKLGYNDSQDVPGAFFNVKLGVYDTIKLDTIGDAYFSDMSNFWSEKWKPLLQGKWENTDHSEVSRDWEPTFSGGFFQWSGQYQKENIINKYELTWAAIDQNVINPDFSNSFYTFADNEKTSKDMLDGLSINTSGTWLKMGAENEIPETALGTRTSDSFADSAEGTGWRKGYIESHYLPTELSATVYDYTRGATSGGEYKIPTLGGLGPISSNAIYLQKDNLNYTFKDRDYTKDITTMNEGFPLIYAKKDSELTWNCTFSNVDGSTAVKNNGEAKVVLSYGEFRDGSESVNNKYVQADGTIGDTEYAFTSKDKACKIKWTMQEDGWIYAKWFPAALTSSSAAAAEGWLVTLDGTQSNKIIYIDKS